MIVYRIGITKWATALNGEGARLHGGRWNHIGTPCIYTSQSRALAVLEYTVNNNIEEIPRLLSITAIEIPNDFLDHPIPLLPGNWRDSPAPASTKDFGTDALKASTDAVLCFPSAILPQEFNYLLNALHPASKLFKVIDVQDFIYDIRIKTV